MTTPAGLTVEQIHKAIGGRWREVARMVGADPGSTPAGHEADELVALLVDKGLIDVVGRDRDGSALYNLTEAGEARARGLLPPDYW